MNKQAVLQEIYQSAFDDELEKVALSPNTLARSTRKALIKNWTTTSLPDALSGNNLRNRAAIAIKEGRTGINIALEKLKGATSYQIREKYGRGSSFYDPSLRDMLKLQLKTIKKHTFRGTPRNIPEKGFQK